MTDSENNFNNFEELEQKLNFLIDTVYQLERRLSKVEKLLSNKNNSSDSESVTVTDSLNIPDIPKTKLSEAEILEIYNNNCHALANNAVKVAVTQESLINKDILFLEKTKPKTASYWILATEDAQYWLLP
ncbi:hypothetical protein ACE1AT_16945 [Pelatocladus sp. BLCC-F211]|uniref:hypothetical protein n=1 Tax=Pelatocladus sp. BLCC-F211 TaxID=3342752 RepID=UPI0035B7A76D